MQFGGRAIWRTFLDIPPLRERRDDIALLAQHYLEVFVKKNRKQIKGFTPGTIDSMIRYDWPGNVRELMNAIERGVVLARSEYLDVEDLAIIQKPMGEAAEILHKPDDIDRDMSLEDVEKDAVLRTLEAANGNKSEAARRLGITRKTLHKKLKKYGIMP